MQDESLAHQAYQEVNDDHLTKGNIREVPGDEPKPLSERFLPQFPVVVQTSPQLKFGLHLMAQLSKLEGV